ncbi:MAG: helix-turn-helix transcriptional regulator [Cyclobacteriaceae bacterium]|nr:MAG: helix-turn-helix transcriptional regulator [Cyclobacteriaceae bacterium]
MPVSYNDLECGHFNDKDGEVCSSIRHYLIQHFLEDHTLEKLSRYFGINPNKLMYLFRKAFNKSVFEYLAELRMEFAKRLLQKGNMRVVDVARAIGYKNPNHFSTAFKRRFGVSPTAIK